ncbi:hypothetical protein V1669_05630 [Aeromonas enteropelogenes]|uniref:hypothetical protein n=1 Tax=Aeromonas enteropelogenes TaxID=29489 RepID=UPI003135C209
MDDKILLEKAKELIELKYELDTLMSKINDLKQDIIQDIKKYGAIKLDSGKVYYGESKGAESFSRKNVLQYLRDTYGDSLADQVDEDCTKHGKPRAIVYVKTNKILPEQL